MEPLTHIFTGAAVGRLGFKRKHVLFVLIFSSIAPDFDYITRLWGADVFLRYHRGITHGLLMLALLPLAMGLIFKYKYKRGFLYYSFLSFMAVGLHLSLDLTNQYGTRVMSPLDWGQMSFDLAFIVDPYILGALILGFVFSTRRKTAAAAAVALIFVFSYVGLRAYLHDKAMSYVKQNVTAYRYSLCPLPNDFLRWCFVAQSNDSITVGSADLFTRRIYIDRRYPVSAAGEDDRRLIELSKKSRVVQNFLYFAKYPYPEVRRAAEGEGENVIIVWRELAFSYLAGTERFRAKVVMSGADGRILDANFKF